MLLAVARDAFVHGMQVAAGISTILAVGVAVLSVAMLRNVKQRAGESAGSDGAAAAGDDAAATSDNELAVAA